MGVTAGTTSGVSCADSSGTDYASTPLKYLVTEGILYEIKGTRLKNHNKRRQVSTQSAPADGRLHDSGPALKRTENGSTSGTLPPVSGRFQKKGLWLWLGIGLLALLHHDFWFWDDARLVFGFIPTGMAYHIVYSILASLLWLIAIRRAWPDELEDWTGSDPSASGGRRIR